MRNRSSGFTLIELAMVLIILGYLLKQFVLPYGARYQQEKRNQTHAQLEIVGQAIDGFAIARHRLPCPASENSNGVAIETCTQANATGFVPAVTLGLRGPVDDKGRLLDGWGHPILYAVSDSDHKSEGLQGQPDFTTAGEMGRVGLSSLRSGIVICREVQAGQCARNQVRANQVPYVVLSHGENAAASGQQAYNQDQDALFVSRAFAQSTETDSGFDDIVVWASESLLIYNLVKAGTLP